MNLVGHTLGLFIVLCVVGGCGRTSGASSNRTPTAAVLTTTPTSSSPNIGAATIARDKATLKRQDYTPDRYAIATSPHGTPIVIFHSICTGSTDGHCQAIHVFRGTQSNPAWSGHYTGVISFRALPDGFSVTSVQYAKSDPLCCPSRPPATAEYRWNGRRFTPAHPLSQDSP